MSNLKLTARQIQRNLGQVFSWEYVFFNVYYNHNTEADCLLLSSAGYLTEVEIKLSISDLRADFNKKKEGFDKIKYFYYVLPQELIERASPMIKEEFGIIAVHRTETCGFQLKYVRTAKQLGNKKIGKYLKCKLFRNLYYKYRDMSWHYNARLDDLEIQRSQECTK